MKIGDILIATDVCEMEDDEEQALKVGKEYIVVDEGENEFAVVDEQRDTHWFDLRPEHEAYYKKYFNHIKSPEIY